MTKFLTGVEPRSSSSQIASIATFPYDFKILKDCTSISEHLPYKRRLNLINLKWLFIRLLPFAGTLAALAWVAVEISQSSSRRVLSPPRTGEGEFATIAPPMSEADLKTYGPVIEELMAQAERFKNINQNMNPTASAGSSCPTCEKLINPVATEKCDSGNGYLQNELESFVSRNKLASELMDLPPDDIAIIRPKCFQLAMSSGAFPAHSRMHVNSCHSSGEAPLRATQRPCVSPTYIQIGANSFNALGKCLRGYFNADKGQEEETLADVFMTIAKESGFHLNAQSESGAGGIGQFTPPAISEVNNTELKNLRSRLKGSSFPVCQEFDKFLNEFGNPPMSPEPEHRCERTSITNGNPITSMIYMFAYAKKVRLDVQSEIQSDSNLTSLFQKSKMSAKDKIKAKAILGVWAHNTGPAGIISALKGVASSGDQIDSLEQFTKALQNHVGAGVGSECRAIEMRNYFELDPQDLGKNCAGSSSVSSLNKTINSYLSGGQKCTYQK